MIIRKLNPADESALIELWETVFPDDPPHNKPESVIAAKLAVDDLIFVAEIDGAIAGACMAGYDGHRGWLYAVAVHPDYRRRRIGEKLVMQVIDQLKRLGCIKLNLQIRSTNTQVAAFYRALGFETEDRLSMGRFIE